MSTRLCAGCREPIPPQNPTGRFKRRDARYHDERCARQARYVRDLIRRSALTGKPLPEWVLR